MAKFDFRRFVREDYPDAPDWISSFFVPLNVAMEQIKSALSGGLTIQDNLRQTVATFELTTPATYTPDASPPAGWTNVNFTLPTRFTAQGVMVVNAYKSASTYDPVTASSVTWRQLSIDQITIFYIGGLEPSTKYTVSVLVI